MSVPRDLGAPDADPAPGTWRPGTYDGKRTAFFCCPKCGTFGSLAGSHEIAANGRVTPSVVCPNCDFHEFIVLDGWSGSDA